MFQMSSSHLMVTVYGMNVNVKKGESEEYVIFIGNAYIQILLWQRFLPHKAYRYDC